MNVSYPWSELAVFASAFIGTDAVRERRVDIVSILAKDDTCPEGVCDYAGEVP